MLQIDVRLKLREFVLDVKTEIAAGVTVIVGASGAGKTTLLRLVAGLLQPEDGRIALGGRVLTGARTFVPPYRRDIGFVFQEYALFPHLDVAENVGFGLRARGCSRAERVARVADTLERLAIGAVAGARVTELSGGQRQRVALARALVVAPKALLLDEPLSALDPDTRAQVRAEMGALLRDVDIPTLFVTHDEADRAALATRTLRLERGRLVGVD